MLVLKEGDVTVKKSESDGKIEAQVVSGSLSEKYDDHFKKRICAIWPNLCLFLKRKLNLEDAASAENDDGSLFELRFKNKKFVLLTQPWAAKTLGLPPKITFSVSEPEMVLHQITALMKKPQSRA